jgi:hypothetical protein
MVETLLKARKDNETEKVKEIVKELKKYIIVVNLLVYDVVCILL